MKLSIVVSTNRSDFWSQFCDSLSQNDTDMEVIFVGPVGDGIDGLSLSVKFLNTGTAPLGAAQCWELGARAATGELLGLMPDDMIFSPGFLDAVRAEASKPHHPYDMFTACYFHNGRNQSSGQRMHSVPALPLLPVAGFSYTETHHRIGGIDKRFYGVFWDADLYQHMCQLGGTTTMLEGYTCEEWNISHQLYAQCELQDRKVLNALWPGPFVPEMQRADPERQRMED